MYFIVKCCWKYLLIISYFKLVVNVVKDYLNKIARNSTIAPSEATIPAIPVRESTVSTYNIVTLKDPLKI
jgi:hypothetical protein